MTARPAKRPGRQASPARTSRDSRELVAMSEHLRDAYGKDVPSGTLERRIQRGIAPRVSLPIQPSTAQCHYLVEIWTHPGPKGTDGIISILFALGLITDNYPEDSVRADLHKLVDTATTKRVTKSGMSRDDRTAHIMGLAGRQATRPKLAADMQVNALIREASKKAGNDRAGQSLDVFDINTDLIEFRDGQQGALPGLIEAIERLFGSPDVTEHEKELIASRYNARRLHDTVDRLPLERLYRLIQVEAWRSHAPSRQRALQWTVPTPDVIRHVVFMAIAEEAVFGDELPPVIDSIAKKGPARPARKRKTTR